MNDPQGRTKRDARPRPWHAASHDDVAKVLKTQPGGLTEVEARDRLEHYGRNSLPPAAPRSAVRRFLAQFDNLLLQVLLVTVAITAAIGHYTDAGVILAVVLINALMGFVQEGKAEQAIRAIQHMLQHMLSLKATVLRQGKRVTVPAETLVPGDIVLVESGDRVPADLRLTRAKNLQIQEAALTGDSLPVSKQTSPAPRPDSADCGAAPPKTNRARRTARQLADQPDPRCAGAPSIPGHGRPARSQRRRAVADRLRYCAARCRATAAAPIMRPPSADDSRSRASPARRISPRMPECRMRAAGDWRALAAACSCRQQSPQIFIALL